MDKRRKRNREVNRGLGLEIYFLKVKKYYKEARAIRKIIKSDTKENYKREGGELLDTRLLATETKCQIRTISVNQILENRKVNIGKIAEAVGEPRAMVKKCLEEIWGLELILKVAGNRTYYNDHSKKNGEKYVRFNDYNQLYYHRYAIAKYVGVEPYELDGYVVHHKNMNTMDNNVNNLHLFLNQQMHQSFHIQYSKNPYIDIVSWSKDYIEQELRDIDEAYFQSDMIKSELLEYEQKLKEYAKFLDKQIEFQNNYKKALDIDMLIPKAVSLEA